MDRKLELPLIQISDVDESIENLINKDYISELTKKRLRDVNIIIMPIENYHDLGKPAFPSGTDEIFTFIKKGLKEEKSIDLCIDDEKYTELSLYSDAIDLGIYFVTSGTLQILINLLSQYIYNKLSRLNQLNRLTKVSITIPQKNGKAKQIKYEGKASDFALIIDKANEILNRE